MRILITGAAGFVGQNLVATLNALNHAGDERVKGLGGIELFCVDKETSSEELENYCAQCDFVVHLAGSNRPKENSEFMAVNRDLTQMIIENLERHKNLVPILLTSSIQADLDNPYGASKRAAEELVLGYGAQTGVPVYVYRLQNLFGKWSLPNYNTVVATFCHNAARGLPLQVNNPNCQITFVYIDDLIDEILRALKGDPHRVGDYCEVSISYTVLLGQLAALIESFAATRQDYSAPNQQDEFARKLYATYTSFLPEDSFSYPLLTHADSRGSFSEFMRMGSAGQVSINISHPKEVKGNHWHNTKTERFLVVCGEAHIRFRKIGENEVISYFVTGEDLRPVDIPTGYTHNIENVGEGDLVTVMWASSAFDPDNPDTFYEEV